MPVNLSLRGSKNPGSYVLVITLVLIKRDKMSVYVVLNMETLFPSKYCLACLAFHTSSECNCNQNVDFPSIFHSPYRCPCWLYTFSVKS